MRKKSYILVLITMLFASCNSSNENQHKSEESVPNEATLIANDTMSFMSDNYHSKNSNFFDVQNNLLLQQNTLDNSIYGFDLESGIQIFKFQLPENGPKRIGKFQGFKYMNKDSIYLLSILENKIKLISSKNDIKKAYELPNSFESKIGALIQLPVLTFGNKLFISCFPEQDYYQDPRFILYDLQNESIEYEIALSDLVPYGNYNLLYALNSITKIDDHTLAISIGVDEKVFIFNVKNHDVKPVKIASDRFNKTEALSKSTNLISTQDRVSRNYYKSIFKLNYEKDTFIFRTTSLATDIKDVDGNYNDLYDKGQSVIIYNLTRNLRLGEFVLPKDEFDFRAGFVYDNKLYISMNNPNSNKDTEQMKFVGFKLLFK